jgi:hypothetical protein
MKIMRGFTPLLAVTAGVALVASGAAWAAGARRTGAAGTGTATSAAASALGPEQS